MSTNPWFDTIHGPRLAQLIAAKGEALKERHHTEDVHFAIWLEAMNRSVQRRILISYDDLEDWDYWSAYDAGMSPKNAAVEMLDHHGYIDAYDEALS